MKRQRHHSNSMLLRTIRNAVLALCLFVSYSPIWAQLNTDHLMNVARNALYFDDYILSIQYFNMIINSKPHLYEPWFYRGEAKFYLEDFSGCEADCTEAIERNPFFPSSYELRGLARISLHKYEDAAEDYKKAVEIRPDNRSLWHNYAICLMESKNYEEADSICDIMIKRWSGQTDGYQIKAQVKLEQKDTLAAETYVDKALEVDKFNFNSLFMKGGMLMSHEKWEEAEKMFDSAIRINPKSAGALINRALSRYHQNNYRGAMKDYDFALEIEPRNFIGHYNRGLLLANVGEDNKAIEDFDFIIKIDPEDFMAIFNRGELLLQTGNYKAAIRDYTTVINEYPEFLYGYQQRAKARRKMGDAKGADKDEMYVIKEQIAHRYGYTTHSRKNKPTKTRKKSEHNIDDYDKLVEDDEDVKKYESEYRGKVQNHNVEATLIKPSELETKHYENAESNKAVALFSSSYDESQKGNVHEAIDLLNQALEFDSTFAEAYYNRGLLRLLLEENTMAIMDLSKAGELGIVSAYNIIKKNQKKKK